MKKTSLPPLKQSPGKLPAWARSACPIGNSLDLLGDRWTLLVIRDMLFFDKRLYGELQDSDEKIPSNILADRLKRLEEHGVLVKREYQKNPVRYEYHLTEKGHALLPVVREITHWANAQLPGTNIAPKGFFQAMAAKKPKRA